MSLPVYKERVSGLPHSRRLWRTATNQSGHKLHDMRPGGEAALAQEIIGKDFKGRKAITFKEFCNWREDIAAPVAHMLGNTVRVAIGSYIAPQVFSAICPPGVNWAEAGLNKNDADEAP